MPCFKSGGRYAFGQLPTRRPFVVRGQVWRSVEPQPGDDRVSVTVARVDRNPSPTSALAVLTEFGRADRRRQQTGSAECVRHRAGTVVTTIDK